MPRNQSAGSSPRMVDGKVPACLLLKDDGMGFSFHMTTIYVLDQHDRHHSRANPEMKMACAINPDLSGRELHDEAGAYPSEADERCGLRICDNAAHARLDTMDAAVDLYPSRREGINPVFAERLDPVVYSNDPDRCPVAREFIESYEENGYLVLEDLFTDADISRFQDETRELMKTWKHRDTDSVIREPGSGDVRTIFQVHATNRLFGKLAADERLAGLAEYILGDRVYIHQSRLNYKPGFRGKEFYWHSDFETWHVEDGMPRMRALSMSIALTDNYEKNGPLMLIPGSHHEYVVCAGETPEEHFRTSLKKQEYGVPDEGMLTDLVARHGIVSIPGKPGTVTLFDSNIMHGSSSNITPFPRSNVFLVYNAISNRVTDPFCSRPPRPEFVASRREISPVSKNTHRPDYYAR